MKVWMMYICVIIALMGCNSEKKEDVSKIADTEDYFVNLFEIPHISHYIGNIPDYAGNPIKVELTITKNENVSDGGYILITTIENQENGKDETSSSRGYLDTLRGCVDDNNATVYRLIDEIDDHIVYFKVTDRNNLLLLTDNLENPGKENGFNYEIFPVP